MPTPSSLTIRQPPCHGLPFTSTKTSLCQCHLNSTSLQTSDARSLVLQFLLHLYCPCHPFDLTLVIQLLIRHLLHFFLSLLLYSPLDMFIQNMPYVFTANYPLSPVLCTTFSSSLFPLFC